MKIIISLSHDGFLLAIATKAAAAHATLDRVAGQASALVTALRQSSEEAGRVYASLGRFTATRDQDPHISRWHMHSRTSQSRRGCDCLAFHDKVDRCR